MNAISHAVFLSYASQDAEAAQQICEALRARGIEVFLDQSELRGGDAWDQKIRREIHDCALFIPVISANTASRHEGYFRLEWDLADQRTHMIARSRVFVVPVCLDATPEVAADVPESFQRVQWTRLPGGRDARCLRRACWRLLSGELAHGADGVSVGRGSRTGCPSTRKGLLASWRSTPRSSQRLRRSSSHSVTLPQTDSCYRSVLRRLERQPRLRLSAPATAFNPPPHSIAVLPFVNLSGDKEQEYFSEGLTEELLNSLSRINELQVAARTSSFSFQGEHPDIATVAHKLNVGAILEGSVRRSANTVRITAQLVNGVSGFHVWSQTYDRSIGDVLAIQTEIANAVANALKVTLLNDLAAKVELGGTRNPAAFDAYLRGLKIFNTVRDYRGEGPAIAAFTEAIKLDPGYAMAFANRSIAQVSYAERLPQGGGSDEIYRRAQADAQRAIDLAPT